MNTPMHLATAPMAAGDKAVSRDALEAVLQLDANSPLKIEAQFSLLLLWLPETRHARKAGTNADFYDLIVRAM